MHTLAPWRLWLVFVTVVAGLLLALPNIYGDAPALQLSRNDRTPATEAGREQVVSLLQSKGVTVDSSYLEGDRMVLRFAGVDAQLNARDVVQETSGNEYLAALSHVP